LKFEWINKQGVKSEDGFVVQRTERFAAEYQEGLSVITIEVDPGFTDDGKPCLGVDRSAFVKWDSNIPIPESKQNVIRQRFREAMLFQNLEVVYYP